MPRSSNGPERLPARVNVAPLDESFPKSRGLPAYGNISIVQVVDQRFPWIYNEDGDIGFNFHDLHHRDRERDRAGRSDRPVPSAACLTRGHGDHPDPTRHRRIACLQPAAGRSWRLAGTEEPHRPSMASQRASPFHAWRLRGRHGMLLRMTSSEFVSMPQVAVGRRRPCPAFIAAAHHATRAGATRPTRRPLRRSSQ